MMALSLLKPCLLVFFVFALSDAWLVPLKCARKRNCVSCTKTKSWSGKSCRWCPTNKKCHAYGAVFTNPCSRKNSNLCDANTRVEINYAVDWLKSDKRRCSNSIQTIPAYCISTNKCSSKINSRSREIFFFINFKKCLFFKGDKLRQNPHKIVEYFCTIVSLNF